MFDARKRELIAEMYPDDDIYLFDNHAYDKSIIGISGDMRAVYSYESMIAELMEDEGWDEEEATEWIEYNTVRAVPYFGENAPIIVYDLL